jgi:hypothetical protein
MEKNSGEKETGQFNCLKCFYTNVECLLGKAEEFRELIYQENYHTVAVTESWLHKYIGESEVSINGFVAYRLVRNDRKGGVCCRITKLNFFSRFYGYWLRGFGMVYLRLTRVKLIVRVFYRSPWSTGVNNDKLLNVLEKKNYFTIQISSFFGDFNYPKNRLKEVQLEHERKRMPISSSRKRRICTLYRM